MVKNVSYGQLRKVLLSLGCKVSTYDDRLVFRDEKRDLLILLRGSEDEQIVRPIDLYSVHRALVGHGYIEDNEDAFDSLFLIRKGDRLIWTDPQSGHETRSPQPRVRVMDWSSSSRTGHCYRVRSIK